MRELHDGEFLIQDSNEVLRRQVAPALFDDGKPMKAAFDDDQTKWLSTLRGSVEAEEAYRRWTEDQGNESVGTYGIQVGFANDLSLPCVADGQHCGVDDHASVVMEDVPTTSARQKIARKLRDAAVAMGPLHTP